MTPEEIVDLFISIFPGRETVSGLEDLELIKEFIFRGFEMRELRVDEYDFFVHSPSSVRFWGLDQTSRFYHTLENCFFYHLGFGIGEGYFKFNGGGDGEGDGNGCGCAQIVKTIV